MHKFGALLLTGLALAGYSYAVETRFWQQSDPSDFEKGSLKNLSLRSDGRLFLAPEFRQVFDPSVPYLWALAADGKGNLYTGGGGTTGGTAKVFAIDATGKGRTLAELDGLEVHAIALGPDGQIYAATDPDGKVYKISPQGKSQLFFDPHAKYIWALAFNSQGDLFVATGDQGEVYRVPPDGRGFVFFKSGETHARSLAFDGQGNLIVGTDPGGLILRVSPSGVGFVLYQTPKREITSVAVAKSGEIYAAAAGVRSAVVAAASAPPPPAPPPAPPAAAPGTRAVTAPASFNAAPPPIVGGSEVYRIAADDSPRKVWSNAQDIVYAIGFDFSNRPLLATGNRGKVYRLDSNQVNTLLIDSSSTQITNFAAVPGHMYAVTGNIGRVYELGSALAKSGSFESEAFDAGSFTYWGRLSFRGTPKNAVIQTRSGNLSRPQEHWSPWAPLQIEKDNAPGACARCLNGRIASPPARFLQYKVVVASSPQSPAPELASIEIAYLAKNVAPVVEDIEITPPNYKFPAPSAPAVTSVSPQTLSLLPIGQKKRPPAVSLDLSGGSSLSYARGMMGARWSASDENNDALTYTVEIRGVGETQWKSIKDKAREKYLSWDSTAFPDGEYELRVTASDLPGNLPAEALTASLITDPFLIDNTPPQILNLASAPAGAKLEIHWTARDARSNIDRAEYSQNGGDWLPVQPKTRLTDAPETEYVLNLDRVGTGEQVIAVRITDAYDNQAVDKIILRP